MKPVSRLYHKPESDEDDEEDPEQCGDGGRDGNKNIDPKCVPLCVTKELGLVADDELKNIEVDKHKIHIPEILRL
ncbi:hypothetical protein FBU30_008595, partial [Linnemannia zychae]